MGDPESPVRTASPVPVETAQDGVEVFDGSWDATDAAHLFPTNLPVRRVLRAWERKPQSPLVKERFARKIWRRVDLPVSRSTAPNDAPHTDPPASSCQARLRIASAIHSPRKIVKKRCVFTSFGQNARANRWDQKAGTPLRKRPVVSSEFIRLTQPSPSRLTSESEQVLLAPESVDQDAWSDIESDDDTPEESQSQQLEDEPEVVEDTESEEACPVDEPTLNDVEASVYVSGEDHPALHDTPDLSDEAENPMSRAQGQDVQTATLPAYPTPLQLHVPASPALSTPHRSSSAPPEQVTPHEHRPIPRISDDTAILHAFLNRAAASKRPTPIAKRESLSNRRDSDVVRQALASPAKNDVLGDLDPNSPSPRKALLPPGTDDHETATGPSSQVVPQVARAAAATPLPPGEQRVMRRSIRSRGRLSTFMPLVEPTPSRAASAGAPSKITIGSATDRVALKRTDAQELALLTRTNTRKNKGGSIMPVLRLCKLAAEPTSPDLLADDSSDTARAKLTRGIRWDQTLVYYQDHSNDGEAQDPDSAEAAPQEIAKLGDAIIAPTPTKSRARRPKALSQPAGQELASETIAPSSDPGRGDTAVAADDTSKAGLPKKRRSRIATPAKALLAPASLLPADVASLADPPTTSTTAKRSSTRSLPAPRKLNLDASVTDGKENRLVSTPKKSGIPSIKMALPRLDPPTDICIEAERVGLASPAKKRAKSGMPKTATATVQRAPTQKDEDLQLPGLCSPAKKRVKPRIL